jgi:PKD repeat protein
MKQPHQVARWLSLTSIIILIFLVSACNLSQAPEESIDQTALPDGTSFITNTPVGLPTSVSIGASPTFLPLPTSVNQLPPTVPPPVIPPSQGVASIFIVSPIPGNTVAGNVQVVGSAIHPSFLQYQLEFGPDPNPQNLWYPIGGVRLTPVSNNVLGIWSTTEGRSPDGLYQLRLRVFLRDGTIAQTVVNNIRVQNQAPTLVPSPTQSTPRPIAAFIASPTSGQAPLVVSFSNRSSGNITGYSWNFGDGSTSNEANPVHTYRQAGTYEVRLTTSGPGGQSNVSSTIDVRAANPPVADFTADVTSGTAPLTARFVNRSSGGQIESFLWDFGDGVTSNERNPQHTFTEPRQYNVILEARGPGGTDRKRMTIVVQDQQVPPPVADFVPKENTGNAPLTVQFANRSSGQINTYEWNFGDGTFGVDPNPLHTYTNAGTYTVTLTVTGNGGQSETTGTVTVNRPPQAPDANFTANPLQGNFPLAVTFNNTSTGDITGYEWSFGDGTPVETSRNVIHTFQRPGTYTVRLTTYGQNNTYDFRDIVISVTEPIQPPRAAFVASTTSGSAPLTVTFTNQSSGDNVRFLWNFGDGSPTTDTRDATVTHTFQNNGTYEVTLTVSNEAGQSETARQTITVTDTLRAAFNAVQLSDPPFGAQFTSSSSGNIQRYAWDFGDGTSEPNGTQNVTHVYARPGTYQVTLTITDNNGQTSSASNAVNIVAPTATPAPPTATPVPPTATAVPATATSVSPTNTPDLPTLEPATNTPTVPTETPLPDLPVAAFEIVNIEGNTVTVQDRSSPTATITTYAWDFGDGIGTSSEQNPQPYTYANPGTYTISLTVANAAGPATTQQQVTIEAPTDVPATNTPETPTLEPATNTPEPPTETPLPELPVAAFEIVAVEGNTVTVQDRSSPTATITTYAWDFGDGIGTSSEQNPQPYTYANPGTYTISLTVANAAGPSTTQQQVTIEAPTALPPTETPLPEQPVAAFEIVGVEGNTVTVQDRSSPTATITAYAWDFGDGIGTSSEQNPQPYTYASPGTYTISLTVANAAGPATTQQQVTIEAPTDVPPTDVPLPEQPVADFRVETADNVTFTFSDRSSPTATITSYAWDFGDGIGSSTEQNPQPYTYTANGQYIVTLTVTNAAGSATAQQTVSVTGIAEETPLPEQPVADFRVETADNITFTFLDRSSPTATITSYTWDFGDGIGTSTEQNPAPYTFTANGEYIVTLTVTNAAGSSTAQQTVSVTGLSEEQPTPEEPTPEEDLNIVDETAVLPDLAPIEANLRAIASSGDTNPAVFTLIGDNSVRQDGFLRPFADGDYQLDEPREGLRAVIDEYIANGAFSRNWSTAGNDLTISSVLNDTSPQCQNGETILVCELTQSNASVALISFGLSDAQNGTDLETFRQEYDQLVKAIIDQNVIPVAMTIYPRPDNLEAIKRINKVIIEVADENDIPVINMWRAFIDRGDAAFDGNNPSVGGGSADILNEETLGQFGENARNFFVLSFLNELRNSVLLRLR